METVDNIELINDDENLNDIQQEIIHIDNGARITIYICLVFVSGFSACDGGILPQQVDNIQKDFGSNSASTVGLFGSIDYIGRVVGALFFAAIMGKMNRKMLLVGTLIFKALTLLIALVTPNKTVNIICRCLSGISQVFYTTYLPVWCDQYGKVKKRAIMVTIVQLASGLGVVIGYGLGLFCDKVFSSQKILGWRSAFAIEGIILIICSIIIFFFKNKYFSNNFVLIKDNEGKEESPKGVKHGNEILSNFGKMLCNKLFLFTTLANSVAFFGMSVVQYWGDKYMENVLNLEKGKRFIAFGCLCLLGPILGMLFGGIICSQLGGYGKRSTMIFIILLVAIGSTISEMTGLFKNTLSFIILSWLFLFLICATIPPESGIIISSLDNNLRGDGFALCNCILNLIGNFPASYVFSLLSDIFESSLEQKDKEEFKHYRIAWSISMGYNFVGLLFLIIAGIYRFRIKGDLSNDESKDVERITIGELEDAKSQ